MFLHYKIEMKLLFCFSPLWSVRHLPGCLPGESCLTSASLLPPVGAVPGLWVTSDGTKRLNCSELKLLMYF